MKCTLTVLVLFLCVLRLSAQTVSHYETIVYDNDNWQYTLPDMFTPTDWMNENFDDIGWSTGQGGLGYGDNDDNTTLNPTLSVFARLEFNVVDANDIGQLILHADYDDGFVAYLNGAEIARDNISGTPPAYDDAANTWIEANLYQGNDPSEITLSPTLLKDGVNVLAFQVHNESIQSSDLSSRFFLTVGIYSTNTHYRTTPSWFTPPPLPPSLSIPIIEITMDNDEDLERNIRKPGTMEVIDNGPGLPNHFIDSPTMIVDIEAEHRGNSSYWFYDKKSIGFKIVDQFQEDLDTNLLGLPSEHDWALHNAFGDKSLLRNVLTYDIAGEIMPWAPRVQFCDVIVNGVDQGLYVLVEKIKRDKKRVEIEKMTSTDNTGDDVTGGYIVKLDRGTTAWTSDYLAPNTDNPENIDFFMHYPKEDDVTTQQVSYIQSQFDDFEDRLDGNNFTDPITGYRSVIDVNSFIDFLIINEFTKNVDGYRLSTYFYKDRDNQGGRISAGPVWDFNLAFGNANYCEGGETYGWGYDFNSTCPDDSYFIPFWWTKLMQDPVFASQVRCRWDELRQGILSESSFSSRVDSLVSHLGNAVDHNFQIWDILDEYVWPNNYVGGNYNNEISYLKTWFRDRAIWLDNNLPSSTAGCTSGLITDLQFSEVMYHDNGLQNTDWVEIHNTGNSTIDLSNWKFSDDNGFNNYYFPIGTSLAPNSYAVITSDLTTFQNLNPGLSNVYGPFAFQLNNDGEDLEIQDEYGRTVITMKYNDGKEWPQTPDGWGRSLERAPGAVDPNLAASWFAGCIGGSPGTSYTPCDPDLVISEINYHSDSVFNSEDWFELENRSGNPLDLSGFSIRDEGKSFPFVFPSNTVLQVDERIIIAHNIDSFEFVHGPIIQPLGPTTFALGNSSEVITISDNQGQIYFSQEYSDTIPWTSEPDGSGYTLELPSTLDPTVATNWESGCFLGSPTRSYEEICEPITGSVKTVEIDITTYPNPTRNDLQVQTSDGIKEFVISDITGSPLERGNPNTHSVLISMEDYPSGTYLLKIESGAGHLRTIPVMKID